MNSVSIGIPLSDTIFSIEFLHFRSSHLYRETIKFLLSDDRFKNLPFCLAGTGDLDISGILFLDCDLDFFSGELLQLFKPYLSNYVLLDFEQCSIYSRFSCNFIDKSLNVDFYMCDFFINNLGGLLPCYIEKLDIRHSNFKNNRVYFTENIGLQRLRIINTDLRVLPIGLSKMLDLKLLAISYNNIIDTIDLCNYPKLELLAAESLDGKIFVSDTCSTRARVMERIPKNCDSSSYGRRSCIDAVTDHRYNLKGDVVF